MNAAIKTFPASAPAAPADDQPSMPVFSTAAALLLLWEKASSSMAPHEVEWMADGASERVGCEARALSATLEGLASLASMDEHAGSFQHSDDLASLLFNLHNQLDTIAGLAGLAESANYRARMALKGGAA